MVVLGTETGDLNTAREGIAGFGVQQFKCNRTLVDHLTPKQKLGMDHLGQKVQI